MRFLAFFLMCGYTFCSAAVLIKIQTSGAVEVDEECGLSQSVHIVWDDPLKRPQKLIANWDEQWERVQEKNFTILKDETGLCALFFPRGIPETVTHLSLSLTQAMVRGLKVPETVRELFLTFPKRVGFREKKREEKGDLDLACLQFDFLRKLRILCTKEDETPVTGFLGGESFNEYLKRNKDLQGCLDLSGVPKAGCIVGIEPQNSFVIMRAREPDCQKTKYRIKWHARIAHIFRAPRAEDFYAVRVRR